MKEPHRVLADSLTVPPLGVGTWAWGDEAVWGMGGYDTNLSIESITGAWEASIDAGIGLFDTAEVYGSGESERIIGRLLADDPQRATEAIIATKFMPVPWKLDVGRSLRRSLEASLERLGVDRVGLYQIHGPISLRGHAPIAEALAEVHRDGLVESVGVSNYSVRELSSITDQLRRRGIQLATNQVEFSLLRRDPETSGLLAACAANGVAVLAYSPIGQGRLTGKYGASNLPQGRRGFGDQPMSQVERIVSELRVIGERHDRTPSQVALNWIIAKGAIPIPGAKNRAQAEDNAGAAGWSLTDSEVADLDAVALTARRTLRSRLWQHG